MTIRHLTDEVIELVWCMREQGLNYEEISHDLGILRADVVEVCEEDRHWDPIAEELQDPDDEDVAAEYIARVAAEIRQGWDRFRWRTAQGLPSQEEEYEIPTVQDWRATIQ